MTDPALDLLRTALGPEASFREHQREALEAIVERKERLLLVQRTGWGKSVVYFLATKMLRAQGHGPALLISPLLSLMRDQQRFADRLGVRARRWDSSNTEEWEAVQKELEANECDLLLVSPERLANSSFREKVMPLLRPGIGLFVVDEAHCISDWGHDFRPDYRRIRSMLAGLPKGVPVLATTATANDRVIQDVEEQMGSGFGTLRGALARRSLRLQTVKLRDKAERLAWLAQELPKLEGTGIVYALTQRDCERVADWLSSKGIHARAYHAGLEDREELEDDLLNNRVKALVATVALGMGFDKPDLRFVVHYQRPGSPVAYYQQVGRAGRGVDRALGVLLAGAEDKEIQSHFIRTAFPEPEQMREILGEIADSEDGLTVGALAARVNLGQRRISQALKLLMVDGAIRRRSKLYVRTPTHWEPDSERWSAVRRQRVEEMKQMDAFLDTDRCLMEFIAQELDDPHAEPCGVCANCAGSLVETSPADDLVREASEFLRRTDLPIHPRKRWPSIPSREIKGNIPEEELCETGRALSVYNEAGLGALVRVGKYEDGNFSDELVEVSVELVRDRWRPEPFPQWVTCVPSLRHPRLVPEFAARLAAGLGLPFRPVLSKIEERKEQKEMENSAHQFVNVDDVLRVDEAAVLKQPVLLVDDIVDSKWTLTVAASLLGRADCPAVFPFALASAGGSR